MYADKTFVGFEFQVEDFLESQKLPKQAILLLDNAPSHPPEDELVKETADGKIWVVYMPPNVTPLIQPMDQNAIRLTKLFYRHSLLSKVVSSGNQIQNELKELNLFEAVSLIACAWEKVSPTVLQKCWKNILVDSEEFEDEDDIPLARLRNQEEVAILTSTLTLVQSSFPEVCNIISVLSIKFDKL